MSALTDLFTALATKIRSKTGGSDTYTPPQMVNAIDDVYQAGVDAGETPTQTKTVTAGTSAVTVTPDAGYALSSVTVNPTPSQSKSATPTTSAQTITPDSGKLLSSVSVGAIPSDYVIPTSITPSNTSPASMASGSAYKPTSSGYAISSYTSISTAQLDSGVYFSSGMKKMASSGYAYSSQPQMTETTLWTNSSPTSSFSSQTVTLTQNMTNYQYLKFDVNVRNTSDTKSCSYIFPISSVQNSIEGANQPRLFLSTNGGGGGQITRSLVYKANTSIQIGGATTSNAYCIPTKISGLKL